MDQAIPATQRVSYHAVTRYVQRVIGVTIDVPETMRERDRARLHCAAARTTIEDVRLMLIPSAVHAAVLAGFPKFRFGGVHYVIKSGIIVTVTKADAPVLEKLRIRSKNELRQRSQRLDRRRHGTPRPVRETEREME